MGPTRVDSGRLAVASKNAATTQATTQATKSALDNSGGWN